MLLMYPTTFLLAFTFNFYFYPYCFITLNNLYCPILLYRVIHKSAEHVRKLADATVE